MKKAKAYIATVTAPVTEWTGPTTGPRRSRQEADRLRLGRPAQRRRQRRRRRRRGGRQGDRLGLPPPRRPGLGPGPHLGADPGDRAEAGRHHPRHRSTPREQAPIVEQAVAAGHQGRRLAFRRHARPDRGHPGGVSPTSPPTRSRSPRPPASTRWSIRAARPTSSSSPTRSTPSPSPRPTPTTAAVESCTGCKVLEIVDTPIGDLSNRMGQLTTSLLSKYGDKWTYSIARERPLLRLRGALADSPPASIPATGYPRQISAGDGSVPAFQRIRDSSTRSPPSPSRCYLHGWQTIDEMNRAFAGEKPSGYVAPRRTSSSRQHRQGRRRPEHLRPGQRLPRPVQEDLGRPVT